MSAREIFDDPLAFVVSATGAVGRAVSVPLAPHAWEAGVLYDATSRTLFCGDLFTRFGEYEASTTDDIAGPAVKAEDDARRVRGRCTPQTQRARSQHDVGTSCRFRRWCPHTIRENLA